MTYIKQKNNIVLLILSIYTLTVFIYRDFGIPTSLGIVILVGILCLEFARTKGKLHVNSTSNAFFALCLFQIIEILRSVIMGNNNQILYIPVLLLLSLCVYTSTASNNGIRITIKIWSIISLVLSIYVIIVAIFPQFYYGYIEKLITEYSRQRIDELLSDGYGVAVGGNIIIICYFVAFIILYNLVELLISSDNKNKLLKILLIIIGFVAFLMINRKTELLALLLSAMFVFFIRIGIASVNRRIRIIFALIMLLALTIVIVFILYKTEHLGRLTKFIETVKTNSNQTASTDVTSGRLVLWSLALEIFSNNPLLGIGWGNYQMYVPDYLSINFDIHNAHNCMLQVLCETGVVGFIIFFSLLLYVFNRVKNNSKMLLRNNNLRLLALNDACMAYQLFFIITMVLDPTIYSLIFWCLYSISIIISINCLRIDKFCRKTMDDVSLINIKEKNFYEK